MKTNAPRSLTWTAGAICGGLGILGHFIALPIITPYAFWLLVIGFLILAISTVVKGI
ncbi:MAG: hypothetical protein K8S54_04370 [Spirochaetia bacterium]|nr:hypothetical protein [Spirochaetia bacterium]